MTKKMVALVTGGAGGIGSEICKELAHKGHQVIAGYHPTEEESAKARLKEWKAEGMHIDIASGDVASFASCAAMAKSIQQKFDPVQILVNCAGITRDKTLKKMTEDDWNAVLNVDLNSLFNVTKQFVDGMTDAGYGRIINISSVNGKKGQFGQTNYSAAKAGVHGFTMALAQEVARKGVTVNSVSPGYTETPMTKAIPEDVSQQINRIGGARLGQIPDIGGEGQVLSPARALHIHQHGDERDIFDDDAHLLARRDKDKAVRVLTQNGREQPDEFLAADRRALMEPGAVARDANVDIAAVRRVPLFDRRQSAARRSLALQAGYTDQKTAFVRHDRCVSVLG